MSHVSHVIYRYSTPCYADAAATLIVTGYTNDTSLLASASKALTKAFTDLVAGTCAQGHCNFYTMPCMFAYMSLKDKVDKQTVTKWEQLAAQMNPDKIYHGGQNNWGVVALAGEVSESSKWS